MTKATYDQRCWDLAVVFLSDSPEKDTDENRRELATAIQQTVEGVVAFQLKPNGLKSTRLEDVFCGSPGVSCKWPECECPRKDLHGTFACPICGENTPHHHSTQVEKQEECSGCMNPLCEDCFDLAVLNSTDEITGPPLSRPDRGTL